MVKRFRRFMAILMAAAIVTSAHPVSMYAQSVSDGSVAEESSEDNSSQDGSEESTETGDSSGTEVSTEESTESGATEEPQYNDLGEPLDEKPDDNSRMPSEGEERDGETTVSDNEGESGKYERLDDTASENEAVSGTISEDTVIDDSVSIDSLSEDTVSDDGIGGNIEATFDFSDDYELSASFTMPAAYSSEKYVLDPEDVGDSKNCWAYTAMGMAETSRMIQTETTKDNFTAYSPQQLVRQFFNPIRTDRAGLTYYSGINALDTRYRDRSILSTNTTTDISALDNTAFLETASGNLAYSTFELARWQGPKSSSLPLSYGNTDELQKFDENDTEAHLRNAYWVPNSDKSSICKLIKQTGSVGLQVYITESGMAAVRSTDGADNYGYHYYNNSVTAPNYTVQLIGWDPNIKADMFAYNGTKPSGNGAFLAKSSYKASNGTYQKYFWISQYDAAFEYKDNTRIAVAYEFNDIDDYDYQYGYDGTNSNQTYSTKRVYTVFTAGEAGQQGGGSDQAEILRAVGVGVGDAGTYEIGVYYYNSNATYLNQYPIETQTVKIPYTGYHTIELEHPILLLRDDRVAVSVKRSDGNAFKAFVDKSSKSPDKSIEFKAYATYGESYFNNPSTGKLVSGNWALKSDLDPDQTDGTPTKSTKNKAAKYQVKYYEKNYYEGMTPRVKMYTDVVERPALVDQTKIKVELTKYVWYYTGNNINPTPRIMVSVNNGEGDTENCIVTPDHYTTTYVNHKNAGIGAVVVRGGTVDSSGNVTKQPDVFSGEISEEFKIVSTQINISKCKIYGVGAQEYDSGNNYEQNNIVVMYKVPETLHYVKLVKGLDYTVGSIEMTNKNGTGASILITGTGAFRNSVKKRFKITNAPVKKKNGTTVSKNGQKSISDRSVTVALADPESGEAWDTVQRVAYDKTKKYKPKVTVSDNSKDGADKTLTEGTDYKVSYKKGKNPGLAQVVIKGKGAYTGKTIAYFIVDPIRITTDAVIKMNPSSYKYTGDPLKPKPRVTLYGKGIPKGSLYCHYNNNTGSSSGTATAQIIVFGRNKYIGYVGYTTFKITASSSSSSS